MDILKNQPSIINTLEKEKLQQYESSAHYDSDIIQQIQVVDFNTAANAKNPASEVFLTQPIHVNGRPLRINALLEVTYGTDENIKNPGTTSYYVIDKENNMYWWNYKTKLYEDEYYLQVKENRIERSKQYVLYENIERDAQDNLETLEQEMQEPYGSFWTSFLFGFDIPEENIPETPKDLTREQREILKTEKVQEIRKKATEIVEKFSEVKENYADFFENIPPDQKNIVTDLEIMISEISHTNTTFSDEYWKNLLDRYNYAIRGLKKYLEYTKKLNIAFEKDEAKKFVVGSEGRTPEETAALEKFIKDFIENMNPLGTPWQDGYNVVRSLFTSDEEWSTFEKYFWTPMIAWENVGMSVANMGRTPIQSFVTIGKSLSIIKDMSLEYVTKNTLSQYALENLEKREGAFSPEELQKKKQSIMQYKANTRIFRIWKAFLKVYQQLPKTEKKTIPLTLFFEILITLKTSSMLSKLSSKFKYSKSRKLLLSGATGSIFASRVAYFTQYTKAVPVALLASIDADYIEI